MALDRGLFDGTAYHGRRGRHVSAKSQSLARSLPASLASSTPQAPRMSFESIFHEMSCSQQETASNFSSMKINAKAGPGGGRASISSC
jgi:hypothetical protein